MIFYFFFWPGSALTVSIPGGEGAGAKWGPGSVATGGTQGGEQQVRRAGARRRAVSIFRHDVGIERSPGLLGWKEGG